jgi:hypothetical protein
MNAGVRGFVGKGVKRFAGVLALVAVLSACTTDAVQGGAGNGYPAATSPRTANPTPTGPSAVAVMVCSAEAQDDIQSTLGLPVTGPPASSFANGLFTCNYRYPVGTMVLTVKDLPDAAATDAYVTAARGTLANVHDLAALGDAAFSDDVSTVYVRKDYAVLHVDTSRLPAQFGQPPHSRLTVAIAVAAAIMLCWKGN